MEAQLETIFGELGMSQYLESFVDQGFDAWDTILDITESDLDVLGVKLGHRRVSKSFCIKRSDSWRKRPGPNVRRNFKDALPTRAGSRQTWPWDHQARCA